MTKLLNIKNPFDVLESNENYIYIGRKRIGMHYGNPFSSKENSLASLRVNTAEESVDMFRKWLNEEDYLDIEPERRKWILEQIDGGALNDKTMVCYNHKGCCHGDVILELLNKNKPNLNKFFTYE